MPSVEALLITEAPGCFGYHPGFIPPHFYLRIGNSVTAIQHSKGQDDNQEEEEIEMRRRIADIKW